MQKFTVGAKVRYKDTPEWGIATVKTVDERTGVVTLQFAKKIDSYGCGYCRKAGIPEGFGWSTNYGYENRYEFIVKPTFKVGDRVTSVYRPPLAKEQDVAVIVKIDASKLHLLRFASDVHGHGDGRREWWSKADNLTLAPETTPKGFKVGDRVKTSYGLGTIKGVNTHFSRFSRGFLAIELDKGFYKYDCDGLTAAGRGFYTPDVSVSAVLAEAPVETPAAPAAPAPIKTKNFQADGQCARILGALIDGEEITPLKAFGTMGVYRLAARIFELRGAGYKIKTTIKADRSGKTYASYRLSRKGKAA